jgi:hypothetical protein
VNEKLPFIVNKLKAPIYVETSHYLTQGALGALLALGVEFDLFLLTRPVREVAVSFWRRQSIPLSKRDKIWPTDPGCMIKLGDHEGLSDYQLVFWWVLEMHARMWDYAERTNEAGGLVASTSLEEVTTWSGFRELTDTLDLPAPRHRMYPHLKINMSDPSMIAMGQPDDLDLLEEQVWERVLCQPQNEGRLSSIPQTSVFTTV